MIYALILTVQLAGASHNVHIKDFPSLQQCQTVSQMVLALFKDGSSVKAKCNPK